MCVRGWHNNGLCVVTACFPVCNMVHSMEQYTLCMETTSVMKAFLDNTMIITVSKVDMECQLPYG